MAISRKKIRDIVRTAIEETSDALVEEELAEAAGLAADRLVQALDDAYDDGDGTPDLSEQDVEE